jgi:hypothetical protein
VTFPGKRVLIKYSFINDLKTDVLFRGQTDEELVEQIVKTKNMVLFGVLYDRYGKQ